MSSKLKNDYIIRKLEEYIRKNNRIPKFFVPYNEKELLDGISCSLATTCGTPGHIGNILIFEVKNE